MQPFTRLDAIAAPLPVANVDTDKILAGRFLKTTTREGLGDKLFWALRRDPGFVLNRAPWDRAGMLIARDNFGCGSSREHAPWALLDFGISCVVAPSFADIFYNNCFKNGLLPIVLPEAEVERLLRLAADPATARMTVDLPAQTIAAGDAVIRFAIDPRRKQDLIEGIDEIAATLAHGDAIARFEARTAAAMPWVADVAEEVLAAD
ncbi:3-isopropylmalate dehydratase small subunit [Rhizorhabdus wittichii]|jgi:3-isopropylmalate/(R)-2-methylmalate dehydratase small subunit|uniref:3-isopropylmalate dehydratase small subunit n=1 Tax=Rhizorhabdus wittichii TaxID=160791 RepID=A0A975D2C2_9SPHN|nr:3-isopropylmalate dehydratase small subunit [Rhizorhabdus wittichii]QTH20921.1 3-isopropylmalate dehydratase small subunit [Rhizorhabdus wittichii]